MVNNQNNKSHLGNLLLVLRKNIRESFRTKRLKYDLTFSQMEAMSFIGQSGKETMGSIAEYLKITPPSATEIITDLEKKGLIARKGDENDRRIVFVVPTDTSKKICSSMLREKDQIFKKIISKLNEKDKKNLERIIKILITK